VYVSGDACLVTGSMWTLSEQLHPVSYHAPRDARPDMRPALEEALRRDLQFQIPENYQRGAVRVLCVVCVVWVCACVVCCVSVCMLCVCVYVCVRVRVKY
jgi:hypothetical protein